MGVAGSGKTTIGKQLAEQLKVPFLEGDDYHPIANISKMKNGQPLTDDDRMPWLQNLAKAGQEHEENGFVMACSALKAKYRNILKLLINRDLNIVFLDGKFETIKKRMEARAGHFMPVELLQSQFEALEVPQNVITYNIEDSPDFIIKDIIKKLEKAEIGVIGLGVMGKSLARNFASKNIRTAVYNLSFKGEENVVSDFVNKYRESNFLTGKNLVDFIEKLKTPRCVLLMIKSGKPVDEMIEKLFPHLENGDMIIDAGNSFFKDTIRRAEYLEEKGIVFVGMGVSGGEEGALKGPSIMPAGTAFAERRLLPMLEKIAAQADGQPCVHWIGENGAGHFVKMVHNGIEYADMQLLAEVYAIGKNVLKLSNLQIADELELWKTSLHNSYLLDITIDILRYEENGESLLEQIKDVAGHKGTGLWTVQEALTLGVPVPTIMAALNQRILSGHKTTYSALEEISDGGEGDFSQSINVTLGTLKNLFLFARLIALAEGFDLMKSAAKKYDWKIDMTAVAQLWRGGCIIRSDMLKLIMEAFEERQVSHLFATQAFLKFIIEEIGEVDSKFGEIAKTGVPTPSLSAAINYYKTLTSNYLSINMIQAQRDYFGAHTYRRRDDPDKIFHTNWKK